PTWSYTSGPWKGPEPPATGSGRQSRPSPTRVPLDRPPQSVGEGHARPEPEGRARRADIAPGVLDVAGALRLVHRIDLPPQDVAEDRHDAIQIDRLAAPDVEHAARNALCVGRRRREVR